MYHLGVADIHAQHIRRELLREAEQERLARLAQQPVRPMRTRLAERLRALAARLDQPAQLGSDAAA